MHLPDGDVLLASAARFLIDGGDEDAASVLLSCDLVAYESGDTWWSGDIQVSAVALELSGPRAAYDALQDRREIPTKVMPPDGIFEQDRVTEMSPSLGLRIERAFGAVLPSDFYVKHFSVSAKLIDLDPDWRTELLEIARGRGVHNQAVTARVPHVWQNLNFRSKSELKIAAALDRANAMFLPNCRARLGVTADYRVNREADFLVCFRGKWGILEVDGEPFHPPERTAQEHERDRLFKQHGLVLIEHFDATVCYQTPDDVVAQFLHLLTAA